MAHYIVINSSYNYVNIFECSLIILWTIRATITTIFCSTHLLRIVSTSSDLCRIRQSKLYFSKGNNYTIDYNSSWEKYAILVRPVSFGLSSRNLFYIRNIICRIVEQEEIKTPPKRDLGHDKRMQNKFQPLHDQYSIRYVSAVRTVR